MQDVASGSETTILLCCTAESAAPEVAGHPLAGEAYELTVSASSIRIIASAAAGVFYGVQSLIQLLPVRLDPAHGGTLPICLSALRVSPLQHALAYFASGRQALRPLIRDYFYVYEITLCINICRDILL